MRIPPAQLRDFCRRHHVVSLYFFGSVLGGDFGPASDVDVLVEFAEDHLPGFFSLGAMEDELSQMLEGRRVDLVTKAALHPLIRERVLAQAQVQYAQG